MRTCNYLLVIVSFVLASCETKAVDLPPEVLRGWEDLRDDSGTYHYAQSTQQEASKKSLGGFQVSARRNDAYAKTEIYFKDATGFGSQKDIHRVILFDGEEYYHLERTKRDSELFVRSFGKTQPGSESIKIGKAVGPMVGNFDLYECAIGEGDCNLLEYHKPTGGDQLVKIVLGPSEGYKGTLERLEVWLEPKQDYRIAKTLKTLNLADGNSNDGRYIQEANYEYAEMKSIPSKVHASTTKLGGNPKDDYPPVIVTIEHLQPNALPKSEFTLEHYGLPSRKRKSSIWMYALVAVVASVAAAAAYRRWRANAV